jgi:hypothetical protein
MGMRAAVLAGVLLLSACGQDGSSTLQTAPTSTAGPRATHAPVTKAEACPTVEPEHLPANVGAVEAAYVCGSDYRAVPGDGDWSFIQVKEVTDGLDELLRVYGAEDAAPTSGACTTELPDPLIVYLHGDHVRAVRAPWTPCRKPTPEARAAYDALTTVVVSETKEAQGRSQLSIDTGCGDTFKDMLWVEEHGGGTHLPTGDPRPVAAGAHVCRYDVKADKDGFRNGELTSGETLSAGELSKVNEELAKSVPDQSCSLSEHTRFATLTDKGSWTQVALDGCALLQDSSWWRATDALRKLLAG